MDTMGTRFTIREAQFGAIIDHRIGVEKPIPQATVNSQVLTPRIKLKRDVVEETWLDVTSILRRLVSLNHHDPTFGT